MIHGAFDDDAFPLVVAHRGASSTHPENTLPAFAAAIDLGAPVIELDVRLTADGHPVVLHDPDLARTAGSGGLVHELPLERVRAANVGTGDRPAVVPLLAEVLELASGRAGVAIEIKNLPGDPGFVADAEPSVAAALAELDRVAFDGPVLVLSFNPRSIATARESATGVLTGFLVTDAVAPDDGLAFAVAEGHDFLLPGARGLLRSGLEVVGRAHDAGLRLGTWTVDDARTFADLLDVGLDAIATNDPAMGLSVAAEHRAA